jgi:hypothetical protein
MSDDLRELDRRVALEVMGWEFVPAEVNDGTRVVERMRELGWEFALYLHPDEEFAHEADELPEYSSDIAAAFRVVERMRDLGLDAELRSFVGEGWEVRFQPPHRVPGRNPQAWHGTASLPLAVCRAALAALEATNV